VTRTERGAETGGRTGRGDIHAGALLRARDGGRRCHVTLKQGVRGGLMDGGGGWQTGH